VFGTLVGGDTAAAIVEYAMILALIAALSIGVIHKPLATSVRHVFQEVVDVFDHVHDDHDDGAENASEIGGANGNDRR